MMSKNGSEQSVLSILSPAVYVVAVLLIFLPPLDILFGLPSISPESARWRFGTIGMLTSAQMLPILGYLLLTMTAVSMQHTWRYRLSLAFGILGVAIMVGLFGAFFLDALQVRREVNEELWPRFNWAVGKSLITQLIQIGVAVLITVLGYRARRATREVVEKRPAGMVRPSPAGKLV